MYDNAQYRPVAGKGQENYTEKSSSKNRDVKCRDNDCDCDFPKKLFLACGNHPQDAIFEIDDDHVEEHQSFILDRVLVDTSCLCKPEVRIEFSSLVVFEAEAERDNDERELEVDLLFELIRVCNGHEECIQNWRYLKEFEVECNDELEVEISEPFTVTFCDKDCPGCCTYKMKVTGKDFDGEFEALRVVKPGISAIAQGIVFD